MWGQRYEAEVKNIFDLQDQITEAVVGAIEPNITVSEIERAKRKRPDSLDAYDSVMRGLPAIWSQDTDTTEGGLRLAERLSPLDPLTFNIFIGMGAAHFEKDEFVEAAWLVLARPPVGDPHSSKRHSKGDWPKQIGLFAERFLDPSHPPGSLS